MSCAKTDEPIEVQLGVWTQVGLRNHGLGGGPDPPWKEAIWGASAMRPLVKINLFDQLLAICLNVMETVRQFCDDAKL